MLCPSNRFHWVALAASCLCVLALSALAGEPPAPRAAAYVPPAGRSVDMQIFDKAVLFLESQQEDDGHWDSKKTGAQPQFCGVNTDIVLTSLATYVMLCTSQGKEQNPQAVACARRAVHWLQTKVRAGGGIADEAGPGEPVVAQMCAGMTFLQAASLSTRDTLRKTAAAMLNYSLFKMQSSAGGYGPSPSAPPRADVLALAALVNQAAKSEKMDFSEPQEKVTDVLKAGLVRLDVQPKAPEGILSRGAADKKPDWDATVSGLLARAFLLTPQKDCLSAIQFILGDFDGKSEGYPQLAQRMAWGEGGYRAVTLWHGTMAILYMYGETTLEYLSWSNTVRALMLEHQSADGGWPVAGEDARYGRVWRTSLHALTAILTAPPPPPPVQPQQPTPP